MVEWRLTLEAYPETTALGSKLDARASEETSNGSV
jgi:hypothetical protein